jgi:hypothetical protein
MLKWDDSIKYYAKTHDVTQSYFSTLKTAVSDSWLKIISFHFYEKMEVNVLNSFRLMHSVRKNEMNFVSLSLVLRGMITDVIIYRYLKQIHKIAGDEGFKIEVNALELSFVKAYKRMTENEKLMAKATAEDAAIIDSKLQNTFKEFYNEGKVLMKASDFRTEEHLAKLENYRKEKNISPNVKIDQEIGKLQFIDDRHKNHINIVYTYLSQIHHFSSRSYNFYKNKEYSNGNPRWAVLTLFVSVLCLIDFIKDIKEDEKVVKELTQIAKEISEMTG